MLNSEIPSAEEFVEQYKMNNKKATVPDMLIKFAQLHAEAALISVTKLDLDDVTVMPDANDFEEGRELHILNAYPKELIK